MSDLTYMDLGDHDSANWPHEDSRRCYRCGVSEEQEMLCVSGLDLVCQTCDSELEREWVDEDSENRRHSLDTFSPYPNS